MSTDTERAAFAPRLAELADAEPISELLKRAFEPFRNQYSRAAFEATTPTVDVVAERLLSQPAWVVESSGGKVIGTVAAVPSADHLYIRSMAVSPAGQGLGIGRALLTAVERFGVGAGNCRLLLSTTPFLIRARQLYESSGFVVIGKDDLHGTPLIQMEKVVVTDASTGAVR